MRFTSFVALGLVPLALVACRGGGGPGDDDDNPDAPVGGSVTIQQVQDPAMPEGTVVELDGVIVTAIDGFGARTGDIYVQEPGGGEFSGIKVFGAPLDIVATLQVGDIVTISNAQKDEFALTADTSGRTTTELTPAGGGVMSIVKTGTGQVPSPVTVDALAIEALATDAERDVEWEKWEGVLITATKVRQLGAVMPFSGGAEDQQKFDATAGLVVESVLANIGTNAAGTCYQGITGIGDYFFDYLLLPRSSADLATGGTECAAQQVTSVNAIQMGTVTGAVELQNVIITARDDIPNSKGIWVADAGQGAQFNGIFVFTGSNLDATFVVGATVDILGSTTEFDVGNPKVGDTVTEITGATITVDTGATVPAPLATTAGIAGDITAGEPMEGVLVSVSTVKVTNAALGQGKVQFTDNNGATIVTDDDLFMTGTFPVLTNGDCRNLVGVMHVQLTDNLRTLLARTAADITVGVGCN